MSAKPFRYINTHIGNNYRNAQAAFKEEYFESKQTLSKTEKHEVITRPHLVVVKMRSTKTYKPRLFRSFGAMPKGHKMENVFIFQAQRSVELYNFVLYQKSSQQKQKERKNKSLPYFPYLRTHEKFSPT